MTIRDVWWRGIVPPFRMLDPSLRHADELLSTTFAGVCSALPDELLAARRLNRVLLSADTTIQVVHRGGRWCIAPGDRLDAQAAAAIAVLAVAGGWSRIKMCVRCGRPFIDRTNGASRRGCVDHPARSNAARRAKATCYTEMPGNTTY